MGLGLHKPITSWFVAVDGRIARGIRVDAFEADPRRGSCFRRRESGLRCSPSCSPDRPGCTRRLWPHRHRRWSPTTTTARLVTCGTTARVTPPRTRVAAGGGRKTNRLWRSIRATPTSSWRGPTTTAPRSSTAMSGPVSTGRPTVVPPGRTVWFPVTPTTRRRPQPRPRRAGFAPRLATRPSRSTPRAGCSTGSSASTVPSRPTARFTWLPTPTMAGRTCARCASIVAPLRRGGCFRTRSTWRRTRPAARTATTSTWRGRPILGSRPTTG
jgi:hypothetical protein